jgi:hypothetical protein
MVKRDGSRKSVPNVPNGQILQSSLDKRIAEVVVKVRGEGNNGSRLQPLVVVVGCSKRFRTLRLTLR